MMLLKKNLINLSAQNKGSSILTHFRSMTFHKFIVKWILVGLKMLNSIEKHISILMTNFGYPINQP